MANYLFLATIPSVSKIIKASRKTEDMWAGSSIIAYLVSELIKTIKSNSKVDIIFPDVSSLPDSFDYASIPNKILLKGDFSSEDEVKDFAKTLKETFDKKLEEIVSFALKQINVYGISDFKDIAIYQVKNSLKFVWGAVPLNEDYKEARKELEKIVGYIKESSFDEETHFQGYKLIDKQSFNAINYDNFKQTQDFEAYSKGAYTCTVCRENVILGASLNDFKGDIFWKELWKQREDKFKEGERLCGFCLSKRFFKEFLNKKSFPSTSEIANICFKKKVLENKEIEHELYNALKGVLDKLPKISSIDILKSGSQSFVLSLDGEWFLPDTWGNKNKYELYGIQDSVAEGIVKSLNEIYGKYKVFPSEIYSLLILDGDNMGEKIADLDENGQRELSKHQAEFTKNAHQIVKDNFGVPVYIGGDDILAFLPKEKAIECAKKLREEYINVMSPLTQLFSNENLKFTISGALIFAHHLLPLQYVLNKLYYLEEEAKSKQDKDSIGVMYIKHSLSSDSYVLKWDEFGRLNELKDIPKSFVYQLASLSEKLEDKKDFVFNRPLLKSLLKRKVNEDKIESILINLPGFSGSLSPSELSSLLKVVFNIFGGENG